MPLAAVHLGVVNCHRRLIADRPRKLVALVGGRFSITRGYRLSRTSQLLGARTNFRCRDKSPSWL